MRLRRAVLPAALLALSACQQSPEPSSGKPALWAVSDAQGRPAGWLFGTIHLLPAGTRWQTPAIADAVANADVLAVEVRDLDPKAIAPVFARLAQPCACPPLAERLPSAARAGLAKTLEDDGVAPGALDRTETWAAALSLAKGDAGSDTAPGADVALIEAFRGRPVVEFEGAADQLAIFDRLPETSQRAMLADVVSADAGDDDDRLMKAWLAGNEDQIVVETRRGMMADPTIHAELLRHRNERWTARIAALIAGGHRPLVAVGAAHVVGPEGLVARLAAQGYTVRRVQ